MHRAVVQVLTAEEELFLPSALPRTRLRAWCEAGEWRLCQLVDTESAHHNTNPAFLPFITGLSCPFMSCEWRKQTVQTTRVSGMRRRPLSFLRMLRCCADSLVSRYCLKPRLKFEITSMGEEKLPVGRCCEFSLGGPYS